MTLDQLRLSTMTLDELALRHGTDKASTGHDYCRTYARYLDAKRDTVRRVLELGVWQGASLRMWRDYFPNAAIVGVDNHPFSTDAMSAAIGPRITLLRRDVSDPEALRDLAQSGPWDLIVDDASHRTEEQVRAARALVPSLDLGGFYAIEDACCAYWAEYQSNRYAPNNEGAMDDALRRLLLESIDGINKHGLRAHGQRRAQACFDCYDDIEWFERQIEALHIHNSLVLFERRAT